MCKFDILVTMDKQTMSFLADQLLPEYACLLLELYGITTIAELVMINDEVIRDIEQNVRVGSFGGHVDFGSRTARIKYLGFDVSDVKQFSFRPLVKRKLLSISAAATCAIDKAKAASTAASIIDEDQSPNQNSPEGQQSELVEGDEFDGDINPPQKKLRIDPDAAKIVLREAAFASKAIALANSIWACTSSQLRVDKSHVTSKYNQAKGIMTASVKCLICPKSIVVSVTKYDASSLASYRCHVTSCHVRKEKEDEKNRSQPTLKATFERKTGKGDGPSDKSDNLNVDLTIDEENSQSEPQTDTAINLSNTGDN